MAKIAKFFTKKVVLILLASVIAVSGIVWVVVANSKPKFKSYIGVIPAANYVSGNGTAAVMVDNYLYFVGDKVATSTIAYGDNEYYAHGTMPAAGIYRVKIQDSQPVLNYTYEEVADDVPEDEKTEPQITAVNDWDTVGRKNNAIEAVVPKIAGHDQTAMWVYGKYLIYVTPHNRMSDRGVLLSGYLDFFRVDLDGKNHTLLYTTDNEGLTTEDFTVWANDPNNIYILVKEDKTIRQINVVTKKSKERVVDLAHDVTGVVFPKAAQYRRQGSPNENLDKVFGGVMSYVYFTKDRDDDNNGNWMYRCHIGDKQPQAELIGNSGDTEVGTTFSLLGVTPLATGDAQFVFMTTTTNTNQAASDAIPYIHVVTNDKMSDYTYVATAGNELGLSSNTTLKIYANGYCTITVSDSTALYRYQIQDHQIALLTTSQGHKKLTTEVTGVLTVMGDTAYVLKNGAVTMVTLDTTTGELRTQGVTITTTTPTDTDTDDSTTAESTTVFTPAVIMQPAGSTGEPMLLVHDTASIRLYTADGKYAPIKFKNN